MLYSHVYVCMHVPVSRYYVCIYVRMYVGIIILSLTYMKSTCQEFNINLPSFLGKSLSARF